MAVIPGAENPSHCQCECRKMKFCGILMVLTAFLLPLKWGTIAAMTDAAGFFPENWLDYLTITWPAHAFGIWSGILLLINTILLPSRKPVRSISGIAMLLWSVGLIAAALPGAMVSTRDVDFAWGEVSNTAGVAAWAMAVWLLQNADDQWFKRMAGAMVAGVLIAGCYGYYQYFYGFAEMREFVAKQLAEGVNVPEAIQLKMADSRITSFLASPNALAGMILIVLPLIWYFGKEWGKLFEPVKLSVPLFRAVGLIITGGALLLCRSRSIVVVFIIAGMLAVFSAPFIKRRYKIAAAILALAMFAGVAGFAVRYGRGFGSMAERADYLRTTVLMIRDNPLSGAGWGGFFYRHMQCKLSSTDEAARDPHNVVAAFAGAGGIFAGILVLAALIFPLAVLWKHRFSPGWRCAVFWSGIFFTLHIFMDCDFHIPAIMAGMLLLYFSALPGGECGERSSKLPIPFFTGVMLISILCNGWFLYGEVKLAEFTDFVNPMDTSTQLRVAGQSFEEVASAAAFARPNLALIPEISGDWYLRNGDMLRAHESYLKAAALNPRRPGIYRRLARIAFLRGDSAAGISLLNKAQAMFPRNPKYSPEHPENRYPSSGSIEGNLQL